MAGAMRVMVSSPGRYSSNTTRGPESALPGGPGYHPTSRVPDRHVSLDRYLGKQSLRAILIAQRSRFPVADKQWPF
jgi:hypothetical protein